MEKVKKKRQFKLKTFKDETNAQNILTKIRVK